MVNAKWQKSTRASGEGVERAIDGAAPPGILLLYL
jgi:hypothetical protein